MPGMTVLHVLEAVGHGTGRHLVDLVTHMDGVDHEVVLPHRPTSRGEGTHTTTGRRLRGHGVPVHEVPLRRSPAHPDLVRGLLAVRRLVRSRGVDLVHGHATVGGVVARVAARTTGRPVVVTPNGIHPSRLVRAVERRLAGVTDAMIAVSPSEATLVRRLGLCAEDRLAVVPNGIATTAPGPHPRDLRRELALGEEARLVGWIGRLAPQKAPEVLVEAAPDLPPHVHVVLVGGGPRAADVATAVRDAGVGARVHVVGHVPEAAGLLPQFDLLALPSRWEGAPYVPLEAFRAGVPVVATDVVGTRDVVVDGETGWLVPVDDPVALAAACRAALDQPAEARRRVDRARRLLHDRHDVQEMAAATANLYARVARSVPGSR